jgi:hypothetical protein
VQVQVLCREGWVAPLVLTEAMSAEQPLMHVHRTARCTLHSALGTNWRA